MASHPTVSTSERLPTVKYFTDMAKISVVVPVYNAEKTVKRCIDSVLAQSLSDFELILINDGSTDGSEKICLEAERSDSRVKYVSKENGGLSSVRNLGIDIAKSEYLSFIDSDDYVDCDMLEFMYQKAIETAADIVLCGYKIESGKTVVENKCEDMLLDGENYSAYMPELKSKNLIDSAWNKLYKRDFVIKSGVRMPEGEIYEDTAFNLSLLAQKPIIAVYGRCFYHYVQNMGSITKRYNREKLSTLKRRARLLKEVTSGIDSYCDFYYIKSVFSSFIDMFLSLKSSEIKQIIKSEISESEFIKAAENADFGGKVNRLIISVAQSGNACRIYAFCRTSYFLKYKMQRLFMRVKK